MSTGEIDFGAIDFFSRDSAAATEQPVSLSVTLPVSDNETVDRKKTQVEVVTDRSTFHEACRSLGRPTGVCCPRCESREVVYNGNYFCSGFDINDQQCKWALPHHDQGRKCTVTGKFVDHKEKYDNLAVALDAGLLETQERERQQEEARAVKRAAKKALQETA